VPAVAAIAGWTRLVARQGLDVWTLVPPRHLERAAPGTRNGEGFVSPDLVGLAAALEQLVLEVRALVALARTRGGEVAVVGLSLGALAAALAATAPDPPDAAALVALPADLAGVLASTGIGRRYAALASLAGAPMPARGALVPMLAPFRPGARAPTARRILVAAGREDRIAPAEDAVALARAWGVEPRLYGRGHLTLLFACRAVRRDLARFLSPLPAESPRGPAATSR
jgi:pimeloyl-ACP methyl ester carboxylesterase